MILTFPINLVNEDQLCLIATVYVINLFSHGEFMVCALTHQPEMLPTWVPEKENRSVVKVNNRI